MSDAHPESPRLAALRARVAAGDYAAIAAFWTEIEESGTPLVERLEGDPDHVLVTFLWREIEPVESVVVMGGLVGFNAEEGRMERLAGTNVWFWSRRARSDVRTTYKLAVRGPDWEHWVHDPLNPLAYTSRRLHDIGEPEDQGFNDSFFELPDAIPARWLALREDAPQGAVTLHRLASAIIDRPRRIWVYTPAGYTEDGDSYPLLVVTDGEMYTQFLPGVLDNMIAAGAIPPLVALLIANPTGDPGRRLHELMCAPDFAAFVHDELHPWAQGTLNVTSDPARSIVAGSSLGGLTAGYLGYRWPDVFGNVLSQSGSFWWRPSERDEHVHLARLYRDSDRLPVRFFLEVGILETVTTPGNGPSQVVSNRHLRDVLLAKGYDVTYREYGGGHNYLAWQTTISDGLIALLNPGWTDTAGRGEPDAAVEAELEQVPA